MYEEFKGKTILVTGACSGMGLATVHSFAQLGANVVMLDVNEDKLKEESSALCAKGYSVIGLVCNVRSYEDIQNAVDTAVKNFGGVDFTVSYAGGFPGRMCNDNKPFWERSLETLEWGIDVNFRAPMYMVRAVFPVMKEQKNGVIINIGSIDGVTGTSWGLDYSAEKSGLIGLTKSTALMGAPYGVRCCMISPGPVLTRAAMANMKTPLGYAAETQEIVDMVMYLCSSKARSITGDNYLIDGGRACGAQN